jgi:hypothetical protein
MGMKIRINHLDTDFAKLWFYPEVGIIHHQFLKPVEGDEFRSVLLTGLELLVEHGAQKWLSDDRYNSMLNPEDADWAQVVWQPQAYDAGWRYWAVLPPLKARGKINMEWIIADVLQGRKVDVRCFDDPDEAWDWLAGEGISGIDRAKISQP